MKPIRAVHVWAALALIAACHLDQLVSGSGGSGGGGGGPPPPPTSGNLKVTTSTTGSNLDPDGYTVTVDGTSSRPITINNSTGVTFTGLAAGSHDVVLSGVAANCSVSGGATQTATVTASQTATLAFSVTCSATTGNLNVTTSTTGSNIDPDGYTVTVDGTNSQPIGSNNGTGVTFTGVATGNRSVALSGVAANCTVSGGATQTVTVTAGQTATLAFSVTCAATTGNLTVTTNTSGSDLDPDGYTVAVDGGTAQPIGINASFTFNGLSAGSHSVTLSGVAGNCTVSGGATQAQTVTAGQTASITFSVTCAALTGSLTVSTSTTGSNQPSGYTVTVDGGQSRSIGAGGTTTYNGLTAANHSVQLNGVPSNCTVSEANPQTVSVPANGTGQASFTITCVPPPNQPPVVDAGPNASLVVGVLYTENASFTDPDHNGPWSWTIDWGDGNSSTGTATSEGSISATHTYLLANSYTITVTVTDAASASGSGQKVVTVQL